MTYKRNSLHPNEFLSTWFSKQTVIVLLQVMEHWLLRAIPTHRVETQPL